MFWIIGAILGAVIGVGAVATNPPGYYLDHPLKRYWVHR